MDSLASLDTIQNNITDSTFSEFQSMITQEKIFEFFDKTKIYTEKAKPKENSHRINKSNFISICQKIFSISSNPYFNQIYDLIFERFKEKKCVFTTNTTFSTNLYLLSDIVSTEKIEIYSVEIFFCVIMQTEFKKKIETIFYITDSDSDGLINESEITKLILTTNKLFCEESSEYLSESTLIQQSLSNIKAKKAISMLIYGEGELRKKLWTNKYISFQEFYESLIKIDNYKYTVIPTFINLKKCLLTQRKEIEFNMNKRCQNDFLKISYELINQNNNLISPRNYLKKFFDQKKIKKKKKVDPLKEIKAKKEKERELKLKRMILIKRNESMKNKLYNKSFSLFMNKTDKKDDIDYLAKYKNENKANNNNISKYVKIKEFHFDNNINNYSANKCKTQYKNFYPSLKKMNSLDTQNEKININKYFKETSNQIKLMKRNSINSVTILKSFKKKSILHSHSNASSINQTRSGSVINKSNINYHKMITFSENIKNNKTLSNFNLDTHYSTTGGITTQKSERTHLTSTQLNKIPFINISKIKIENNKNINNNNKNNSHINKIRSLFRKSKLFNPNNKNNSMISKRSTPNIYENLNNNKMVEIGDYYKFTSIIFPPCVINNKDKSENSKIYSKKGNLTDRGAKKSIINQKIDINDCLLKTYHEVKDEILYELEQQKNNDIHGLDAIIKIRKQIEEKKDTFPLIELSKNI